MTFEENYREILAAQNDVLWKIAFQARKRNTVLLCLERDPNECHRRLVAEELVERCLISGVTHLTPHTPGPQWAPQTPVRPSDEVIPDKA